MSADGLSAIEAVQMRYRALRWSILWRATTDALTFFDEYFVGQLTPSFSLFAKIIATELTEDDFTRRKAQRLTKAVLADEANQMSAAGQVSSSALAVGGT